MSDDFDFDSFLNDIKSGLDDGSFDWDAQEPRKQPQERLQPERREIIPSVPEKAVKRQQRAAKMVEAGEKMQRAGERMQEAGETTTKAGSKVTGFVALVLLVLFLIFAVKGCGGGKNETKESRIDADVPTQAETVAVIPDVKVEQNSTSNASAGQNNALQSAQSYLLLMAFSADGLKSQLEYDGYTADEIQYAIDNCSADWQAEANEAAKNYLDFMAFSHDGLIQQLEYDKFTAEQAQNAVDNCGADWSEQAARAAKNYLDFMSFSRDDLIDQLQYDGYTYEQAVYGAEQNGY